MTERDEMHFADAYTAARKQVSDRLAAEIVARNASDDSTKFHRTDGEDDAELVRRIVATYLALTAAPAPGVREWQPMETAPVKHYAEVQPWYCFRCLLQTVSGEVIEGYGRYVKLGRATTTMTLRWYRANDRQCFPKLWMLLPVAAIASGEGK